MVKALCDHGVEAEIATSNNNDDTALLPVPCHQRVIYQEVPIWFFPTLGRNSTFKFSAPFTRWIGRHVHQYDVVHIHTLFTYIPTVAGMAARRHRIPYLVRTIGMLTPWALKQGQLKKRFYTEIFERRQLERAAAIHCTSPEEAEEVKQLGIQTPIITLPLGVNAPTLLPEASQRLRHRYGLPDTGPIVLFLSRLNPKKRPDLLIKALGELAPAHQFHACLAGAGTPPYIAELQHLVAKLGLTQRVTFTGFVTGEAKDLLLQGADLFVLPSFAENFGVAVAEALAAGLPVVITPGIQIAPAVAAAQAGLVVEGQVTTLATALAQLLKHPELRQQLGRNGQQLARQQYSWDAISRDLMQIYGEVL
jgi:glycosyltransferase involved in cell wall biosynthesis